MNTARLVLEHKQLWQQSRWSQKRLHVRLEELWDKVRTWAAANGKIYDPSYGIVDVAAM